MIGHGFTRSDGDHCIYFIEKVNHFIIVVLYVDDILLLSDSKELVKMTKFDLSREFGMKDLGPLHYFLGIEVKRDRLEGFG